MVVVKRSLFIVRVMVPVAVVQLLPEPAVSLARLRDRYQSGIPSAMKPWGALVNISSTVMLGTHSLRDILHLSRKFSAVGPVSPQWDLR